MKFKLWAVCVAILFLFGAWGYIQGLCKKDSGVFENASSSIFGYADEVFSPYGFFTEGEGKKELLKRINDGEVPGYWQKNGEDWVNPWMVSALVVCNLLEYDRKGRLDDVQLDTCLLTMESIRKSFERHGKFPRPAYQKFKEGWVSSMDAPSIMVASRMLYEITGDKKWHDFLKMLSKYALSEISEDGFNFRLDKNMVWPLEYAQNDLLFDDAEFVLNGSLVGYLGMYMCAGVEKDSELAEYCNTVEKTYEKMFPEFPYKNYTWTRYALHPPVICQPHYVFFERTLFSALSILTGKPMFERELSRRTDYLKFILKPQFKNIGTERYFIIHRAKAPHPYYIDVYPSKVVFYDADGKEVSVFEEGRDRRRMFKDAEFMFGKVPEQAVRYAYFRKDTRQKIFEDNIEEGDFPKETDAMKACEYTLRVANDAQVLENGDVRIANDLSPQTEATLIYDLHEAEALDENYLYGIEIDNLVEEDLDCGLIIRDDKEGLGRTYTPLALGKNLILFNILGFQGIDSNKIKDMRRIDFRIYMNNTEVDGICRVGRILRFKDLFELRDYRNQSEYEIQPQ